MNSPQADNPAVRLDASGHIDQDCACVSCGYNLRGLDPDRVCPECATPISRSIRGDYLRFSDPKWVGTLARGMNWIVFGFISACALGIGMELVLDQNVTTGNSHLDTLGESLLVLAFQLVFVKGFWHLTEREPFWKSAESALSARRVIRLTLLASLALVPMGYLTDYFHEVNGTAVFFVGIVGVSAVYKHIISLVRRLPNRSLEWGIRWLVTGIGVLFAFAFLSLLLSVLWDHFSLDNIKMYISMVVMMLMLLGFALLGIWTMVLAVWFQIALHKAARQAREKAALQP